MLSRLLAEHVVASSYDALPEASRAAARRALLDGLGVMLGGSGEAAVLPFVTLARADAPLGGRASVLGHGFRTSAALAALANGAMAHALDFEDAFDAAPCHPNASLLPAALAIAEAHGPVGGEELLAAVAVGCDLVCRLALCLKRPMEAGGWYPPPILGAFGAAAAAAKLLRLDARQVLDTFSLVLGQNSMPGEIKYSGDGAMRAIREAFPAQAAVNSALLARAGVRGYDAPFEGKAGFFRLFADGHYDPAILLDRLGGMWWIDQLTFKRWPCCRGIHAYIEAIESLRLRGVPLDWRRIRRVTLAGGEIQRMLAEPLDRKRRPANDIEAKFSLLFTVAAMLVHDDVTLDSFGPARLADADVHRVADRIAYREMPDWRRTRASGGVVEIEMDDGAVHEEGIELAQGHPDRPLSDDALYTKFADCASRVAMGRTAALPDMREKMAMLAASPDVGAWLGSIL
jgi:2-methylcitrate dehydratase PrpD